MKNFYGFTLTEAFTPHPAGPRKAYQVSVILNLFQDLDETLKHRGQSDVQGDVRRKLGKLCAFTLAEVLITLGVIGVVAAVSMPTLIQNHRKSVAETRLAKFYSTMNQVIQKAEADYGDKLTWETYDKLYEKDEDGKNDTTKPIPNTEYFDKYFRPYIVAVKIETVSNSSEVIVYFPDGSVATFNSESIVFYPNGKDFSIVESETTSIKFGRRDQIGTKAFDFLFNPSNKNTAFKYHYSKGIEPYKYDWDGTKEKLLDDNRFGCKETVSIEQAYCTALIQLNGWKIPKDYPLRF